MSNMRDMYRDNQDMTSNMMGQDMSSNMRDMHRQNQAIGFTGPNQYMVKDDFGNYAYSYNDQQSEKTEQGNDQSIKGQYAYIMSNGIKRRVEYIADNDGFHIIRDNADPARIKRSVEPDLTQTRMTSVLDSSSLRGNTREMYRMSNMMGRDMSSNIDRNMKDVEQQRYSNMMGQDTLGRNMMIQDDMGRNMMGRDMSSNMDRNRMVQDNMVRNMMGRNIYNIVSNRMGQQMNSNMMGRDMTMKSLNMIGQDRNSQMMGPNIMGQQEMTPKTMYSNVMGQDTMDMTNNRMTSNMMGQDRTSQMMGRKMLGHQDMTPNTMYSNLMGQPMGQRDEERDGDMMDMTNNMMLSNMMSSRGMSSDSLINNGLMGQRMMQRMEIERVPETYTSTRFF